MPYHALNPVERDTFNARRQLLAHIGNILREKAVEREKVRFEEDRTCKLHAIFIHADLCTYLE